MDGEWIAIEKLPVEKAQDAFFTDLTCVKSNPVHSVNIMAIWHDSKHEQWFFVTSFDSLEVAQRYYRKRFTTETLFSDWKSRGFFLHDTRLRHPERVNWLLLSGAIAYIFTIIIGVSSILSKAYENLVRADFMFYSLFQLGLIFLQHLLNQVLDFPSLNSLAPPDSFHFSWG